MVHDLSRPTLSWSKELWGRAAVTATSDPCPRSCGDTCYTGPLGTGSELTQGRPAIKPTEYRVRTDSGSTHGHRRLSPESEELGVDQLSWPTSPGFEQTQDRPVIPADSDPGPKSCGVDQSSRLTRSWVQGAACRPAVPANSDTGP